MISSLWRTNRLGGVSNIQALGKVCELINGRKVSECSTCHAIHSKSLIQ